MDFYLVNNAAIMDTFYDHQESHMELIWVESGAAIYKTIDDRLNNNC